MVGEVVMRQSIQLASSAVDHPRAPILDEADSAIRTNAVFVIFTSVADTLAAVRVARDFAKPLGVPITVFHFRTVPFALPVDEPCGLSPVESADFMACLRSENLDVHVRVCLCRDERQAARLAFREHSLIVVGGRFSWWPTGSNRWRRLLEEAGHFVIGVDQAPAARARIASLRAPQRERAWMGPREQ